MNASNPTILRLLKDRKCQPELHQLTSPYVQTTRQWLYRFTPPAVDVLAKGLTADALIEYGLQFHFSGWTPPESWPQQLAESADLAALPPAVLTASFLPAKNAGKALVSREKLQSHVVGLLSRRAANDPLGIVRGAFMPNLLQLAKIDLERHVEELWWLRTECPQGFEAALECIGRTLSNPNAKARAKHVIEGHYLLHRASYLQLIAAYIASSTRAELAKFFVPLVDHRSASSDSVLAWMDTLATASSDGLEGFIRAEATGGKPGSQGRLSRPELFMQAVTNKWEKHVGAAGVREYTRALLPEAPRIRDMIGYFSDMPPAAIDETNAARAALYSLAKLKPPSVKGLRLFHIWNAGLDGTTMLIAMIRRFAEIVCLVRDRPLLLKARTNGTPVRLIYASLAHATVMNIASEFASEVMGGFVPVPRKPSHRYKIADVMLNRRIDVLLSDVMSREKQIWLAFDPVSSRGVHGTLYPDLDL